MTVPHLMPLLKPGEMRVSITVSPTGVVGEMAVNVTPEQIPGGWPQVIKLCLAGVEVAVQQLAQAPQVQVPQILLPGNGERH